MVTKRENVILKTDSSDGDVKCYCPKCGEELEQSDIEMFFSCPFCGCPLEASERLEDFLMQNIVRNWVAKTNNHY